MSNIVKNTIIVFITILFAMIGFFSISFFERAYRYTTIDEEASDIIANYIGFDVSKIQRIDKIIYQSYIRDSDMYIFAEVDWPELWESSLTISAVEIKDLINRRALIWILFQHPVKKILYADGNTFSIGNRFVVFCAYPRTSTI